MSTPTALREDKRPREMPPLEVPLWLAIALPICVALAIYAQTYLGTFAFVNYDDPELVSMANPAIGKGLWHGLLALLDPSADPQFLHAWLPLYYGSIGIDHALGELLTGDGFGAAWIYHLHSALLHGLGAALVVLIGRRLRMTTLSALVAGLLFAVHPMAVESVAWIASRKDSLSFVWMGFATLAYLRAVDRGHVAGHVLGAMLLGVSMLAKGTTLVLPFLLVVHAVWLREDRDTPVWRRLLPVAPYVVIAGGLTLLHASIAAREGTAFAGGTGGGVGDVLLANLAVVGHYVAGFFAPLRLSVEHGVTPDNFGTGMAVLGAVVLAVWGTALVWSLRSDRRGWTAVLVAVPLALAPFNNVFPRTTVLFAERYAYVPLSVVCLGLGALLSGVRGRPQKLGPAVLAVLVFGILTVLRIPAWSDSERLWEDAAEKAPGSSFVFLQLGQARAEKYVYTVNEARRARASGNAGAFSTAQAAARQLDAGTRHAWTVAANNPRRPLDLGRARTGLAQHLLAYDPLEQVTAEDVRVRLERIVALLDEAVAAFEKAALEFPAGPRRRAARVGWLADPLAHRGTAHELLGHPETAEADWGELVKLQPENARALAALGRVYRLLDRLEDAVVMLDRSREIEPRDPSLVLDRVKVRMSLGQAREALEEMEAALVDSSGEPLLTREHVPLYLALGQFRLRLRRPRDAELAFRFARKADPDDLKARAGLGAALLEQAQSFALREDLDEASQAAEEALTLLPGQFAAYQILAIIDRRAGRLEAATERLRKAHELFPAGLRIRDALASILVEQGGKALRGGAIGAALVFLEEAVALKAKVISTPSRRLELGVRAWPPTAASDGASGRVRVDALSGLALLAAGDPVWARKHFDSAVQGLEAADQDLARVVLDLWARCLFEVELPVEALAAALRVYELGLAPGEEVWQPKSRLASSYMEHGIALRGQDDPEGADKSFTTARRLLSEAVLESMPATQEQLRQGEIRFAEERFLDATAHFDEAVRLDPRNVDAYLDLAAVWRTQYLLEEDPSYLDGATEDLRKALKIAPGDPRVLAGLGETLVMSGRQSDGLPFLMRAILADPSQKGARILAARLMIQAGRRRLEGGEVKQARDVADRALALDPPHPEASIFFAAVLRAENDWERARVTLEDAISRWPEFAETRNALAKFYNDLGHAYLLTKDEGRAITAFHKALAVKDSDLDPDGPQSRLVMIAKRAFGLGVEASQAGDQDAAARSFRLSTAADPTPETWFALGVVENRRKETTAAIAAYGEALTLRPQYLEALVNRANASVSLGQLDAAATDYQSWLKHAPADHVKRGSIESELRLIARVKKEIEDEERDSPPR